MVRITSDFLSTPLVHIGLPGLIADVRRDTGATVRAEDLFPGLFPQLSSWLDELVATSQIRPDAHAGWVVELLVGSVFMHHIAFPANVIDDGWIDCAAALVTRGVTITPGTVNVPVRPE